MALGASRTGKMNKGLRQRFPVNGTYLSSREMEVLSMMINGLMNKEMAGRLFISIKTVEKHRANVLRKLRVDGALAAARVAIRTGLVTLELWLSCSIGENIDRQGFVSGQQTSESSLVHRVAE